MNTDAFLSMLARCEGTDGFDGYRALFGYSSSTNRPVFDGYLDHPRVHTPFTQTNGVRNFTSAAGRYQITEPTWDRVSKKLWPYIVTPMFTPENQDAVALELISEQGAMGALTNGDFQTAIDRCAPIWASLPASKYPQPVRSYAFAQQAYLEAGGVLA